jgi:ubiquinone/menaquinone biosynthesis C-methylase UbiE
MSSLSHYVRDYRRMVRKMMQTRPPDEAASAAVGGWFDTIGPLQRDLLRGVGLHDDDYVIDVGCGSGRTAVALRDIPTLRYLGIDVVPELIAYARKIVDRPDWNFAVVDGLTIPERDAQADMVLMFSVLTHLSPSEGRRYVADAVRVLKPGGRLVASFLDPAIEHDRQAAGSWYLQTKLRLRGQGVRNQLLRPDEIAGWARELSVAAVFHGREQIGQRYVVLTK